MVFETWLDSDLQKPVIVRQLTGNLFSADSGANKIGAVVKDNGEAATLSGNVYGYFIRHDGATVVMEGDLDGNKASVTLAASCYAAVGQFSFVLKVGQSTVAACTGYVYSSTTDTIVDPGHVVPSITELLERISDCIAATKAAVAAASSATRAAGSANTAATAATTAANKLENMTAAANAGGAALDPTVAVTTENGHYVLTFSNVKGATGATPNLQIGAVTTLNAGERATASITGTTDDPLLNLGIPRGPSGSQIIDDTAGSGVTDRAWSANKLSAIKAKVDGLNAIVLSGTLTGSGATVSTTLSNAAITATMRPIIHYDSDTAVITGNVSMSVDTGSVVVSANVKGTINFTLTLFEPTN